MPGSSNKTSNFKTVAAFVITDLDNVSCNMYVYVYGCLHPNGILLTPTVQDQNEAYCVNIHPRHH